MKRRRKMGRQEAVRLLAFWKQAAEMVDEFYPLAHPDDRVWAIDSAGTGFESFDRELRSRRLSRVRAMRSTARQTMRSRGRPE